MRRWDITANKQNEKVVNDVTNINVFIVFRHT